MSYKVPCKHIGFIYSSQNETSHSVPLLVFNLKEHTQVFPRVALKVHYCLILIFLLLIEPLKMKIFLTYFMPMTVIFYSHKNINIVTNFLNNSFKSINKKLDHLHLVVAPKKCKVVIFH